MKRIIMVLMAMVMMFSANTVFAQNAWVQEGYDFTASQSALIDSLKYVPNARDEMKPDDIYKTIVGEMKNSLFIKTRDAAQYNAVLTEKNINIAALDKKEAKKVYADNMKGYVDIRIVPTVVSKSKTFLFIDVFDTATNKLIYSNQFDDRKIDTVEVYQEVTKQFCDEFNKIMKRDKFKK